MGYDSIFVQNASPKIEMTVLSCECVKIVFFLFFLGFVLRAAELQRTLLRL